MKALFVDCHVLFREGISLYLLRNSAIDVIDGCSGFVEMCEFLGNSNYDLLIVEGRTKDASGIEFLSYVKEAFPNVLIMMLSAETNPIVIHRFMDKGVSAYISKYSDPKLLVEAVVAVLSGKTYFPVEYLEPKSNNNFGRGGDRSSYTILICLSNKQRAVLRLLLQGKQNKAISAILNISQNTVKAHLSAIYRTLGASNRTEAVYFAAKAGVPLDISLHSEFLHIDHKHAS